MEMHLEIVAVAKDGLQPDDPFPFSDAADRKSCRYFGLDLVCIFRGGL